MKEKNIKKIIKEQSKLIETPNVLSNIKNDFGIDDKQIMTNQSNRQSFKAKLTLSFSMIIVFIISIGIFRMQTSDPMNDDSIVEALVVSSIASTEIVNQSVEPLSDSQILQVSDQSLLTQTVEDDIKNEADYLSTYINMMATLTNANQKLSIEKSRISTFSNQYMLSFSEENLSKENKNYQLIYQTMSKSKQVYTVEGILSYDSESYQVKIIYDKSNHSLTYETYKDDQNYIRVTFGKQSEYAIYEVSRVVNDEVTESIEVKYKNRLNITLSFTKGEAHGSYSFELKTSMFGRKYLDVSYSVNQYQGTMQIAVSLENRDEFVFVVTPDDGETFTFNKQRNRNGK